MTRARTPREAVAYYRVSTQKQGRSGLGLEAQQAAVVNLALMRGLTLVREFTEIESGRKKNRAQLEAALDLCRRTGAVLLIAKLDRLTRNLAAGAALLESDVPFMAADSPDASRMELQIRLVIAEQEAQFISERTKAALAARKARGQLLGNPAAFTPEVRAAGPQAQREAARVATQQAAALAVVLRQRGDALANIADSLNAAGFRTRQGALWSASQVHRILRREVA